MINIIILNSGRVLNWHNGLKASEREKKRIENQEKIRTLQIFHNMLTNTYIIYNSMHQDLLIFEKAILLFKFGAVLYLGEAQRLNSLLKEYSCFCSPLVSYIRKILNFIVHYYFSLFMIIMKTDEISCQNLGA